MKTTLALALFAILTIGFASCSAETTTNDMSQFPTSVKNTVTKNFKSKVLSATSETNTFGESEYEVVLADGSKIKFEGEEWEEVKVPAGQSVPETFVIAPIQTYVTKNQPGQTIVKIEKDKKGYDVELSNGIDIEFDLNGNFIKID